MHCRFILGNHRSLGICNLRFQMSRQSTAQLLFVINDAFFACMWDVLHIDWNGKQFHLHTTHMEGVARTVCTLCKVSIYALSQALFSLCF